MADTSIIHIDLDAFFVSVEQVFNPELKGKPVVVGGKPGGRGVVAAASYEARAFGLHSAMPLKTASRLCPHAIFIEGSFPRYREASKKFMAILADFTPFLEPGGLDEAYLDVTGFESLHDSIHRMAVSIRQRIQDELGLCASVGIASGKIIAKVASELSKPDGLIEVARGEEQAFLAPLGVGKLPGVGKKAERTLELLGIDTIGKLSVTPVAVLKRHLGVSGEGLHRSANGIDDRKVETSGAAKSISRETTFGKDTRNRVYLKATLRYLGERVGADLRRQGKQARSINLKLRYADFTTLTRSHTPPQATDGDLMIFQTGLKLLDKALAAEKQPVRLIGIGVSNLVEAGGQLAMLDSSAQRQVQLNKTIDRIRQKYGFTSIQTGQTLLLKDLYSEKNKDYNLHTPSLSR
ncbi:MAG: DNA polymerase IV [Dehalococcoidales bacterium]|jgi:DNA polymerase-4|nr:DNA polymerase IV [Dehalococcoidales bacterium]